MRAALYFRVSTDEQKERASIETQREFAAQYCKVHDITVIASYSDDGFSGTIPVADRPDGSRLLIDARAKKFDTILVYKLDRLARSTLEILKVVEALGQWGIAIKSMTEPFETDSSVGKFLVSMLASVAQLQRDAIRDRSGAGMERLARQGKWLGGRPSFGYQVADGKLAIHPEQAEVVKEIFGMFLSGSTQRAIAHHLNAQGVIHPLGLDREGVNRLWHEATISKLLRDTVYAGTFRWRKTTARKRLGRRITFIKAPESRQISCSVPAIISGEDFEETQRRLEENLRRSPRNARKFYLLRSLVKCGCCGRNYVGLTATNRKRNQYYRCGSHCRKIGVEPCEGKAVRADVLDLRVWDHCAAFISNPAAVLDEVRQTMQASQQDQNDLNDRIGSLDSRLAGKLTERARVINLARRGLISDKEAEHELTRLQGEVSQLETERADSVTIKPSAGRAA
jgi:site-specific DNA recombinase